jgi:hypothetical protein
VELYLHSPNLPPWHGAQLKYRDKFTFLTFTFFIIKCNLVLISVSDVKDGQVNGSSKDIELKGKHKCGRVEVCEYTLIVMMTS